MQTCPICGSSLVVAKLSCGCCQVDYTGCFHLPRLARLDAAQQKLAEHFLLSGGNLKELAQQQGITYPTLRKQIDNLILALQQLKGEDEQAISEMLERVESGKLTAEAAERLIRERNGDA